MPEVVLYCTGTCPYCERAERLLVKKGSKPDKLRIDSDAELFEEMKQRSGRETVPQIFIGKRHIGGYDDLVELDIEGELDSLLGIE